MYLLRLHKYISMNILLLYSYNNSDIINFCPHSVINRTWRYHLVSDKTSRSCKWISSIMLNITIYGLTCCSNCRTWACVCRCSCKCRVCSSLSLPWLFGTRIWHTWLDCRTRYRMPELSRWPEHTFHTGTWSLHNAVLSLLWVITLSTIDTLDILNLLQLLCDESPFLLSLHWFLCKKRYGQV